MLEKTLEDRNLSNANVVVALGEIFVSFIEDKHRFQRDSAISVLENWKHGSYKNWYTNNSLIHNSQKGNTRSLLTKEGINKLRVHSTVLLSHNNMLQCRKLKTR